MRPEELERRQRRAMEETFVINETTEGIRIFSPTGSGRPFLVRGIPDEPICSCLDFQKHSDDPEWRCKHILAVLSSRKTELDADGSYESEERDAIQDEAQVDVKKAPSPENGASQMLLKRSISPDGHIDALSVEFSCPVEHVSVRDITSRAAQMLNLQREIVDRFLNGNHQNSHPGPTRRGGADDPLPAEMINIGGMNGKWGRRLFIRFAVNGQILMRFGNQKQLAECITAAGFPEVAAHVGEGVCLNLPCRVITKPSKNSRFLDIDKVLPMDIAGAERSAGQ